MAVVSFDLERGKDELRPLTSGGSFENIYQLLYYTTLLKYVTQEHIKSIGFAGVGKVATKGKLQTLRELGYLRTSKINPQIFSSTNKTYKVLKKIGHYLKLLPALPKGDGAEIYNTDAFVQALKLTNYNALLYPQFPKEKPYIIPDALMILKEENRYQLNFLEIEAEKPNWDYYLQTKYDSYKRLAKDIQVYKYWKTFSGYLNLACPPIEKFKFRVIIIGSIKKSWGPGFEFRSKL